MTAPATINYRRFRTYDDPMSMLDRGATMSVKNHMTIQKYPNIKRPSNIVDVLT